MKQWIWVTLLSDVWHAASSKILLSCHIFANAFCTAQGATAFRSFLCCWTQSQEAVELQLSATGCAGPDSRMKLRWTPWNTSTHNAYPNLAAEKPGIQFLFLFPEWQVVLFLCYSPMLWMCRRAISKSSISGCAINILSLFSRCVWVIGGDCNFVRKARLLNFTLFFSG